MIARFDNLSINEIHLQTLKIHSEVKRRHVFSIILPVTSKRTMIDYRPPAERSLNQSINHSVRIPKIPKSISVSLFFLFLVLIPKDLNTN